jgi:hypothetical protein
MNVPETESAVWRLVGLSVALSLFALLGAFWLQARQRKRVAA